jgi:hypothetical protein
VPEVDTGIDERFDKVCLRLSHSILRCGLLVSGRQPVREHFGQDEATAMGLKKLRGFKTTTRLSGERKRYKAFARKRFLASRAKECTEVGGAIQAAEGKV